MRPPRQVARRAAKQLKRLVLVVLRFTATQVVYVLHFLKLLRVDTPLLVIETRADAHDEVVRAVVAQLEHGGVSFRLVVTKQQLGNLDERSRARLQYSPRSSWLAEAMVRALVRRGVPTLLTTAWSATFSQPVLLSSRTNFAQIVHRPERFLKAHWDRHRSKSWAEFNASQIFFASPRVASPTRTPLWLTEPIIDYETLRASGTQNRVLVVGANGYSTEAWEALFYCASFLPHVYFRLVGQMFSHHQGAVRLARILSLPNVEPLGATKRVGLHTLQTECESATALLIPKTPAQYTTVWSGSAALAGRYALPVVAPCAVARGWKLDLGFTYSDIAESHGSYGHGPALQIGRICSMSSDAYWRYRLDLSEAYQSQYNDSALSLSNISQRLSSKRSRPRLGGLLK